MVKSLNIPRWLNIGLILVTLLAYLSPFIDPNFFWPPAFIALLYPWLILANLFFVAFWAVNRRWHALLSLGCLLIGAGHMRATVGIASTVSAPDNATVVKVVSFNCHSFMDYRNDNAPVSEPELIASLQKMDADVLCLQEFPVKPRLAKMYTTYVQQHTGLTYQYQQGELSIFSRYPLKNLQTNFFANRANGYQQVDLQVAGRPVRLYNIHLQSNAITGLSERVVQHGEIQNKRTWLYILRILVRYRRSAALRARQADELAREVSASPHPVLLCGDFNDVPLSYAYRQLADGLTDTFKKRGGGLAVTYAGKIPGLRIDYILTDPTIPVLQYEKTSIRFSDHHPITARIALPEK